MLEECSKKWLIDDEGLKTSFSCITAAVYRAPPQLGGSAPRHRASSYVAPSGLDCNSWTCELLWEPAGHIPDAPMASKSYSREALDWYALGEQSSVDVCAQNRPRFAFLPLPPTPPTRTEHERRSLEVLLGEEAAALHTAHTSIIYTTHHSNVGDSRVFRSIGCRFHVYSGFHGHPREATSRDEEMIGRRISFRLDRM